MRIPFWPKKSNRELLNNCLAQLIVLRKESDILAICAQPTGYAWLGVSVATKSLFPKNTFEIPQYYSNAIFTEEELILLANKINSLYFKQVIWSGFAPFYELVCNNLHAEIKQKVIYHGFLAELASNQIQISVFNTLIKLGKRKKIIAFGFVKKGLALSFESKYHLPSFEVILPNRNVLNRTSQGSDEINIGCLVNNSFRKNIHNQVFAASMVQTANVHVFENKDLQYLDSGQLIYYKHLEHDKFVNLLGSMTLNLHVTFSEGMGGQVCAESISQGVPCISAYTSSFFDYDEELKARLVVDGFDDSWHIYRKIAEVLKERDYLSIRCIEYSEYLNVLAIKRFSLFMNY